MTSVLKLLVIVLILSGCASKGFNRGALEEQIGVIKPENTDKDIQKAYATKSNLPKPFRLAVYFKRHKGNSYLKGSQWRWTEKDKEQILDAAKKLKSENLISDVFPIMGSLVAEEDMKSVRVAAAQHGADAVLVVGGVGDIDRYTNNLGWSYLLIVTSAMVPGSEADALFLTNASMWDVRNEFLYITAEAEGMAKDTHAALFGARDEELLERAKTASLESLKNQVVDMVKGVKR